MHEGLIFYFELRLSFSKAVFFFEIQRPVYGAGLYHLIGG